MRPRPPSNLCNAIAAFTLIELLMVLVVLTVVVALVAPSLSQFSAGRRNRDTATQFLALANYARTQAITEARIYRLNIDSAHRTLWLTSSTNGTFARPNSDFGDPYEWASDIRATIDFPQHTDGNYVEFHPDSRNEVGRVWWTDKLGGVIEVSCQSATEQFRIFSAEETEAMP